MTRPYKYQRQDVEQIQEWSVSNHNRARVLVANEMGTGKTPTSLWWMKWYLKKGPTIVVCPANLKWNWKAEIAKHVGYKTIVLDGMSPPSYGIKIKDPDTIIVINYEILGPWVPHLLAIKPKLLVIDESHYCKSPRAKRTLFTKAMAARVPHMLALSGTPLTNRPAELWPVLNMLRPDLFPRFFPFGKRYCAAEKNHWGWVFPGATHLKELHRKLRKNLMIRRRKVDVLKYLPRKTRTVVPMDIKDRKQYEEARDNFYNWLMKHHPGRVYRSMLAQYMTQLGYLIRLAGKLKLKQVIDWVENFLQETDEKIILFGVHREILDALHERFKNVSVIVHGGIKGKEREKRYNTFNRKKSCRIFIGQLKATGLGWSCKSASTVAFVEMGWAPADHTQAEDRIHGIGRGSGVKASIFYLIAKGTIEEKLVEVIQRKQKVMDEALDGEVMQGGFDVHSVMKDMVKSLTKTMEKYIKGTREWN